MGAEVWLSSNGGRRCLICGAAHASCQGDTPDGGGPVSEYLEVVLSGDYFTAPYRMYLTRDGKEVVRRGDPRAAILLAAEGGNIPIEQAQELGLLDEKGKELKEPEPVKEGAVTVEVQPEIAEKAQEAAPETKAVKGPAETKQVKKKETK